MSSINNELCCYLSTFFYHSSVSDPDKRLQALWVVCDKLPKNNKNNLRSVAEAYIGTDFAFVCHARLFSPLCPLCFLLGIW